MLILSSNFLEDDDMVKQNCSRLSTNLENVQRFPGFGLLACEFPNSFNEFPILGKCRRRRNVVAFHFVTPLLVRRALSITEVHSRITQWAAGSRLRQHDRWLVIKFSSGAWSVARD
jgi:hypothetical protein